MQKGPVLQIFFILQHQKRRYNPHRWENRWDLTKLAGSNCFWPLTIVGLYLWLLGALSLPCLTLLRYDGAKSIWSTPPFWSQGSWQAR